MVAWQSNPNLGALVADLGPYIGPDWSAAFPPLTGIFPGDAGEIDYYVLDPSVDDYLTFSSPTGSAWSDSYTYNGGGTLYTGAYTDGSSSGPPTGAHVYVAWYDTTFSTVPAAPSVSPESLTRSDYSALGTLAPPVYHWGPWITPSPQTFTQIPASVGYEWGYTGSLVSVADSLTTPLDPTIDYAGSFAWADTDGGNKGVSGQALAPSPALATYAIQNGVGPSGFDNAHPSLPADAVDVQYETTWATHADAPSMLASIISMSWEVHLDEHTPLSDPRDCTVYFWLEDPANVMVVDATYGKTGRIGGSPTASEALAGYAARIGEVTVPTTTNLVSVTLDLPTSAFCSVLLPDRPDESPGVYVNMAILEGIQGLDGSPGAGLTAGRQFYMASSPLTVVYEPPRYRFKLIGPGDLTIPPLRQFHRDDGLAGGARSQVNPTSRQASQRQGINGTYL